MELGNPIGIWALLALVPFIIIYLIKPRPKDMTIPSLMFLIKQTQRFKQNAFLRKLLRSVLFFIQLLLLLALAFSIAAPFITVPFAVESENTVIILDSSASMQTKVGTQTRFAKAISLARNSLSGRVSIIAAENMPITLLKDGNYVEAQAALLKARPKATTTNLGDALLLADDLLKEKKGRILVLSDFIQTEGSDLLVAKRTLTSRGNNVDLVDLSSKASNIGIIDMELTKHDTKIFLKNFNDKEEEIKVKLIKGTQTLGEETIKLLPNSLESLVFETQTGQSKIVLETDDDLELDNIAYISGPEKKTINVLLITNEEKSSLKAALQASQDILLAISNPPLAHMVDGKAIKFTDFDIVIIGDVGKEGDKEGILKGRFREFQDYMDKGGKLIITGQEDLGELAQTDRSRKIFWELAPVAITGIGNKTRICFKIFNQFTEQFEENNCPSESQSYLKADPAENSIVIASATDNSPMIAYKGSVFYYGIIDPKSDFSSLSSYPIFWNELINFMVKTEDINDYNYIAGTSIVIPEQRVRTPSSSIKTTKLLLDEHGLYEFNSKKVAVNMLDEKESDISKETDIIEQDKKEFKTSTELKKKKIDLDYYLIILVLSIIFLEIFYIKRRGDI
jgi:hypothetical protein